jgi:glycerophosphoryl diester phosphodiesterase
VTPCGRRRDSIGGVPRCEIIAHRGASAYAPEHTLAAYDLALAQGADTLELDVRATAAGELVLVHDATLARTVGDPRPVAALTRAAVAALPPALRPLRLDDVLARYGAAARYLVELKDPSPAWEGAAAAAVRRHGLERRAALQSFDVRAVRWLALAHPQLECVALYRRRPRSGRTLEAVASFAAGVAVCHRFADRAFVLAAHARGLSVRAWTANERAEIERLLALGVDGVITDAPDVAVAAAGVAATASLRSVA